MKLEAGKYYRTRSGHKAFVAYVATQEQEIDVEKENEKAIGWLYGETQSWGVDGFCLSRLRPVVEDIVAEWHEPAVRTVAVKLYRPQDGKPFATLKNLSEFPLIGSASVTITEGQFADELDGL